MKKLLVVLALLSAGFLYREQLYSWVRPPRSTGDAKVVLYATQWCGYCRMTRRFLKQNGIEYVEYDVEKSPEGQERYRALGGEGVPLLQVNGRVIHGYNPKAILAALR
jgi:mycoredoxin